MPCLWPRPERGRSIAASPGSPMWIAMPVGTRWVSPGASVTGPSRQARRSMPAEPSVAYSGSGMSLPMRVSSTFSRTLCIEAFSLLIVVAVVVAIVRGDQRNQLARHGVLVVLGNLRAAALPEDLQRVRVGIEALA